VTNSWSDKPRLGQRLVEVGLLSPADLEQILQKQRETGLPLGHMLVEGGYVAGHSVAMALADQHGGLLKTEYGFATGWSGTPAETVERPRPEQPTPKPAQPTTKAAPSQPVEAPNLASQLRIVQTPAADAPAQPAAAPELRTSNEQPEAQLASGAHAAPAGEEPARQPRSRRWLRLRSG
jgi:hypothetical protein